MKDALWTEVDDYLEGLFVGEDPALAANLADSSAAGLPAIEVSPSHGKMLSLLARATGARAILEVGTLGGYSTTWLARGLAEGGRLVTLEMSPRHAEVAKANLARAGLAERVEIRVGPASETLPKLAGPFDLIFIDADKPGYPDYLRQAIRLSRPGTLIIADNAVRAGGILDPAKGDENARAMRGFLESTSADARVSSTVVQTVGRKGHDGFLMAVVNAV